MRLIHWLFHSKGKWRLVAEVPLWGKPEIVGSGVKYAVGNQPMVTKTYYTTNGTNVAILGPDSGYLLKGKLVEQERICADCGLTQKKWDKVKVG